MFRKDRGGFKPKFAPVKVGDELDVKIEAIGGKGDGIAKKDGFVLFVPNTKEGDEVKVRVTRVLRNVGFAEVAGQGGGQKDAGSYEQRENSDYQESSDSEENQESGQDESQNVEDSENFGEESKEEY